MVDLAQARQILVGDFRCAQLGRGSSGAKPGAGVTTDAFVGACNCELDGLQGIQLSGKTITGVSCHLSENADSSGGAGPRRFRVVDKHGLSRYVYNLQLDIGLEGHNLCLGLDDSSLDQAAGAADGHSPDSAPSAAQVIDDLASMLKKRSARMTED